MVLKWKLFSDRSISLSEKNKTRYQQSKPGIKKPSYFDQNFGKINSFHISSYDFRIIYKTVPHREIVSMVSKADLRQIKGGMIGPKRTSKSRVIPIRTLG